MQMNNLPLVSVIVPVSNVEQYLHRSIDSLLAQTYKNLEAVFGDNKRNIFCSTILPFSLFVVNFIHNT